MNGIDTNILTRRFHDIEASSNGDATWDKWQLSGVATLRRGRAVPIIVDTRQYLRRQTKEDYRRLGKLHLATAEFE